MVLTKLQAATFHALLAVTAGAIQFIHRDKGFLTEMWTLYAAVAVGHAVIDKTGAQVSAFKNRKLDAEAPPTDAMTTEVKITKTETP